MKTVDEIISMSIDHPAYKGVRDLILSSKEQEQALRGHLLESFQEGKYLDLEFVLLQDGTPCVARRDNNEVTVYDPALRRSETMPIPIGDFTFEVR